jgi:hypothetical protein
MPFTQAILDNFNRANENPLSGGGNWQGRGSAPLQIVSNQATGTGSSGFFYGVWLPGGAVSGDVEAYATLGVRDNWSEVTARVQAGTAGSAPLGYAFGSHSDGSTVIEKLDGTGLGGGGAGTLALSAGDKIGIRCVGTTIEGWTWTAAGGWVKQLSVIDSSYSSGLFGLKQGHNVGTLDDFAAGLAAAAAAGFVPQIIWFTPAPLVTGGVPAAPTFESATTYSLPANRPAVTGTTRPFASSAALTGALNAASPGDLVSYTGAGILDISGNYTGFAGRRYTGYVNIDLGLPASANHVRFTGGGGAGLPAVGIYNSAFLRIYGGEITNPPPKSVGHDGLHIYGAGVAGNGSTNHIVWWNLLVHDTVDSGIKMLPNVPFGGSGQTALDNTIADCDIEAEVYMIGRDKTADTHPEPGTGQHCCLLADTDPSGATYPSFLRNRVAIDGHDTGLSSSQGGGSIVELGFNDAASTITGNTLIIRGLHTLFNAQQQTAGNGLNLWGDAATGATVQFLQHSNATGSAVSNYPPGQNRSGVIVVYGRHSSTNQNAWEGTQPWQIGPTYRDVA